ncbi:MAG: leucine-rich repeat domain-containing protein [Clostridium sp.]|nr:MAG: leucine-rich repeat domain-containing protein [Clostridium sp.]
MLLCFDLKNIGAYAFSECKSLTTMALPRYLPKIDMGAFC